MWLIDLDTNSETLSTHSNKTHNSEHMPFMSYSDHFTPSYWNDCQQNMCYYSDDPVRSVVIQYGDIKQCMSAMASLAQRLLLQFESRGNHPSGTGNTLLHHNQGYPGKWICYVLMHCLVHHPLPSRLQHCTGIVKMRLYMCDGSHLPVGWAVWWWPLLWRAMGECHRSFLAWGKYTRRHECLYLHQTHQHRPWCTSCTLQGGCRMEDCTILVRTFCDSGTLGI